MQKKPQRKKRRSTYSEKAKQHRAAFSQNFLKNAAAADRAIAKAAIPAKAVVVEIGPGDGALTTRIAKQAGIVYAIEKDARYAKKAQKQFADVENVHIVHSDFLRYTLPAGEYHVVANPPFSIMNALIKKCLLAKNTPKTVTLFAQREAAERLTMKKRGYEFGVLTAPWFSYAIVDRFRPTDFSPQPNVDVVLLRIEKRKKPLSVHADADPRMYQQFVAYTFSQQQKPLHSALKHLFTHQQWKRIASDIKIPKNAGATTITTEQWAQLFERFMTFVSPEKQQRIFSR